MIRSHQSTG